MRGGGGFISWIFFLFRLQFIENQMIHMDNAVVIELIFFFFFWLSINSIRWESYKNMGGLQSFWQIKSLLLSLLILRQWNVRVYSIFTYLFWAIEVFLMIFRFNTMDFATLFNLSYWNWNQINHCHNWMKEERNKKNQRKESMKCGKKSTYVICFLFLLKLICYWVFVWMYAALSVNVKCANCPTISWIDKLRHFIFNCFGFSFNFIVNYSISILF